MALLKEYRSLISRMEKLLTDLDRLELPSVAVHVDHAARRLEKIAQEQEDRTLRDNG
jgi:hypothetical protein